MVDIKLLCNLSAVVPGEVVTPPCLRGIGLDILVILAVNFIFHASAVPVIDFRSTAGKIPFFSHLCCLRTVIDHSQLQSVLIHWPLVCQGA